MVFVTLGMTTVGAVLLVWFWGSNLAPSTRVTLSAVLGPAAFMVPIVLLAGNGGMGSEELWVLAIIIVLPIITIGWPVAFFATRKLDRMTVNSASVFE